MRDALAHLADRDRFFEAPEVLPPRDHPVYRDALPGPPIDKDTNVRGATRDGALLERHDDAATAFLERVNGTATVISKDAILIEDDVACGTMGCGGEVFARRPPPLARAATSPHVVPNLKNRGRALRELKNAGGRGLRSGRRGLGPLAARAHLIRP